MTLLERYIAVATVKALGVVSAGLTSLFSLLEFVDQLHDVGKGHYRLIDALFYESARTWVETGVIRPFPGIWVAPALLAGVVIFALLEPRLTFGLGRRRAA